jgi:TonB family protein
MKNKIKTMRSRQQITDEEINNYMDFDRLLQLNNNMLVRQRYFRMIRQASIGGGLLATGIIAIIYFFGSSEQSKEITQATLTTEDRITTTLQKQSPIAYGDSLVIQDNNNVSSVDKSVQTIVNHAEDIDTREDQKSEADNILGNPEQINIERQHTKIVYDQAEPVNGYPDLYAYFDRELIYPREAIKDSTQGVVTVVFSIDPEGKPQEIKIENSLGKLFDKEVLRLMMNMPLWKPASYNGKHVNSKVSLPLTFELKKISPKN